LSPLYNLMLSVEAGEWENVSGICEEIHLSEPFISESQWKAMEWAQQVSDIDR
jgi:hypothetical protein